MYGLKTIKTLSCKTVGSVKHTCPSRRELKQIELTNIIKNKMKIHHYQDAKVSNMLHVLLSPQKRFQTKC